MPSRATHTATDEQALNATLRQQTTRLVEDAKVTAKAKRRSRGRKKEDEDLEATAKSAMQQADLIRALVAPMEAEIVELKRKLVKARKRNISIENSGDYRAVSPRPDSAFEMFKSTTVMTEMKEIQQTLKREREQRAEVNIKLQLKETEYHALLADHENIKVLALSRDLAPSWTAIHGNSIGVQVAYEVEKRSLRESKMAMDALGSKFMLTVQKLQQHISRLEERDKNGTSGAGNGGEEGGPASPERVVRVISPNNGGPLAAAVAEMAEVTNALQEERTALKRAGTHDWKLQKSQLESEAKALRMKLEAANGRIRTLEETVADLNAAALKPCDYCADYEYKVVTMQEEVRLAAQKVEETEAQVAQAIADVQVRVDEATLRNSRHLKLSMDDLETRMAEKAHNQVTVCWLYSAHQSSSSPAHVAVDRSRRAVHCER